MERETKITTIAVIISFLLSVCAFLTVRTGYSESRAIGGEGLLLLWPIITYVVCKNISLSISVFCKPKECDPEDLEMQVISQPRKLDEEKPRMVIAIKGSEDCS